MFDLVFGVTVTSRGFVGVALVLVEENKSVRVRADILVVVEVVLENGSIVLVGVPLALDEYETETDAVMLLVMVCHSCDTVIETDEEKEVEDVEEEVAVAPSTEIEKDSLRLFVSLPVPLHVILCDVVSSTELECNDRLRVMVCV